MLELQDICFEVTDENSGGKKEILKNINLRIETGEFVVITGPNGSGKSTLSKIIMGIENPTSGRILFEGQDITDMSVYERAQMGIGFAFQQPIRFKGIEVKDLLRLSTGRMLSVDEACSYLAEVGLCASDYVNRELNESLSGGEIKRIEIAMLMARHVKFSIFDEPEAGIDLWSFHNLINVFEKLKKSTKGSIVVISHQERILEVADKIVLIKAGEIEDIGDKETILPKLLVGSNACEYYRK